MILSVGAHRSGAGEIRVDVFHGHLGARNSCTGRISHGSEDGGGCALSECRRQYKAGGEQDNSFHKTVFPSMRLLLTTPLRPPFVEVKRSDPRRKT